LAKEPTTHETEKTSALFFLKPTLNQEEEEERMDEEEAKRPNTHIHCQLADIVVKATTHAEAVEVLIKEHMENERRNVPNRIIASGCGCIEPSNEEECPFSIGNNRHGTRRLETLKLIDDRIEKVRELFMKTINIMQSNPSCCWPSQKQHLQTKQCKAVVASASILCELIVFSADLVFNEFHRAPIGGYRQVEPRSEQDNWFAACIAEEARYREMQREEEERGEPHHLQGRQRPKIGRPWRIDVNETSTGIVCFLGVAAMMSRIRSCSVLGPLICCPAWFVSTILLRKRFGCGCCKRAENSSNPLLNKDERSPIEKIVDRIEEKKQHALSDSVYLFNQPMEKDCQCIEKCKEAKTCSAFGESFIVGHKVFTDHGTGFFGKHGDFFYEHARKFRPPHPPERLMKKKEK